MDDEGIPEQHFVEPASKPPNPFDQLDLPSDVAAAQAAPADCADYTIALAALVLASALYAAARAVGWVLDGFIGSDRQSRMRDS